MADCIFCNASSSIALQDEDSAYLFSNLQNIWKQHISSKNRNQTWTEINATTSMSQMEIDLTTTPLKIFNGATQTQDNQMDMNSLLSTPKDLFSDEDMFSMSVRSKTTSKTAFWDLGTHKNSPNQTYKFKRMLTFEENIDVPQKSANENFHVTTLSTIEQAIEETYNDTLFVNGYETFREEFNNVTPEHHKTSARTCKKRMRESSILLNRNKTATRPSSKTASKGWLSKAQTQTKKKMKQLRDCVTPPGFWDLDFPPTPLTQPESPNYLATLSRNKF